MLPTDLTLPLRSFIFYLVFFLLAQASSAQQPQEGLPPYKLYSSKDYQANPQNWSLVQDKRGVIYVANTEGVLEFDGVSWRRAFSGKLARSLMLGEDGVVYVGLVSGFGYLHPDEGGQVKLVLLDSLVPKGIDITIIENIHEVDDQVYFVSYNEVYVYDKSTNLIEVFHSEDKIYPSFQFREQVIFNIGGRGLCHLVDGQFASAPNGYFFENKSISAVVPIDRDSVLTLDSRFGAHVYTQDSVFSLSAFDRPFYQNNRVYKATRLTDGGYALCFLTGGLVITDSDLYPVLHLNETLGFENQVHQSFQDIYGDLWVCTNSGLEYLNLSSPLRFFDKKNGLDGAVYDIEVKDGNLFVSGNAGVFYKPWKSNVDVLNSNARKFERVVNTEIIGVQLINTQPKLLSIHTKTVGEIEGNTFKPIMPVNAYMASAVILSDPSQVLVTTAESHKLALFQYVDDHWSVVDYIENDQLPQDLLMKMVLDPHSGRIWACNYQAQLLSFQFDLEKREITDIRYYDESHGLPPLEQGIRLPILLNDSAMIVSQQGLHKPAKDARSILKDQRFKGTFDDEGFFYLTMQNDSTYWYSTRENKQGKAMVSNGGDEVIREEHFSKYLNLTSSTEVFISEGKGVLFGGLEGMVLMDPSKQENTDILHSPRITKVDVIRGGDSTVFGGFFFDELDNVAKEQMEIPQFKSEENAFRFTFALPYFRGNGEVQYRYKLDGFDTEWSEWSEKNEKDYTNIPAGSFKFLVEAKNLFDEKSAQASYTFQVFPPWYLTVWAYLAYVVLLGLLIWFIVRVNSRRLIRENLKLEGIISDRTKEITEQAERIKELDKVKTRFFSNISHEFRTPLTLVQGPIQSILLGKETEREGIFHNLTVANRNVEVLRNLIDEILEFNKLEMGNVDFRLDSVFVEEYLDELAPAFHQLAADQEVVFSAEYKGLSGLKLDLPVDQVERVINNLVSNAMKHCKKHGEVKLIVAYDSELLNISVCDEGPGIAEEDQRLIFERFYQTNLGKHQPHSSGVGLAYVKEIAGALGGDIQLQSELGKGSTFTFSIPVQKSKFAHLSEKETEEDFQESVFGEFTYANNKVLIVEDNEDLARYIHQVLGDEFEVRKASNGKEALELLQEFDADLIISDIMMPQMDGMELLSELKSHPQWRYKSVVMLTAKSSHEVKIAALSFGLDDYITKPFSPLELEARVKNILRNQHERNQFLIQSSEDPIEVIDPLIQELVTFIEENLSNRNFGVLSLSEKAALSDRQLTRVIKKATGLTPAALIREVKLSKAKAFLEQKTYRSVAEVSYAVAFEKTSHFSKVYFERYGKKPSEYL